jgi:Raf kinase inhibitor-like YbhB/YbcL family protein
VPTGTVEVALVVDDPDAPGGTYVHWVVVGLDPASTTLAEATVATGVRQIRNSAAKAAYTGPCPPGGPTHHYRFTIYALQRRAEIGADASPEAAYGQLGVDGWSELPIAIARCKAISRLGVHDTVVLDVVAASTSHGPSAVEGGRAAWLPG